MLAYWRDKLTPSAKLFSTQFTAMTTLNAKLLKAIEQHNAEEVNSLLLQGADANAISEYGYYALHLAASLHWLSDFLNTTLNAIKLVDAHLPLIISTLEGQKKIVRLLLEHGADANAKTKNYESASPLYCATRFDWSIGVAVDSANDLRKQSQEGDTASAHTPIIEVQSLCQPSPQSTDSSDCIKLLPQIYLATLNTHIELLSLLLEYGATLNDKERHEDTPLLNAALNAPLPVVRFLLQNGANINATTAAGDTALHIAAWDGRDDIVKCLLEHGADINAKNESGETALYKAVCYGAHTNAARILLEHGADDYILKKKGKLFMMAAQTFDNDGMIQLLQEYGVNADIV